MSDDNVTLELVGARLLGLTAHVHDLVQRFTGMEARFDAFEVRLGALETRFAGLEGRFTGLERRYTVQEERISRLLALVVRIAERQGVKE